MGKSTDRKRLEKGAQLKKQECEQAALAIEQENSVVEQNRQEDEAKMEAFFLWCQKTFAGYRLPESECEITVARTPWADAYNIHAYLGDYRLPPGVGFVSLALAQVGRNTQGRVPGFLLLVLVRCVNSHWEIVEETGEKSVATEEEVRDRLIDLVAEVACGRLSKICETIRKATGKLHL
jgi:hypothetical protein